MPSQKISFTLSARLARKQKITPENGSTFNCSFTKAASPSIPLRKSTGFVAKPALAVSALHRSCVRAPNGAKHCFNVSRLGAARTHLDGSDYDLNGGRATLMRGFAWPCRFQGYHWHEGWRLIGRQRSLAALIHIRNHGTCHDRLRNDPSLILIAPSSAADYAGDFYVAPSELRVVTNVVHNVHTTSIHEIHDRALWRSFSYVG